MYQEICLFFSHFFILTTVAALHADSNYTAGRAPGKEKLFFRILVLFFPPNTHRFPITNYVYTSVMPFDMTLGAVFIHHLPVVIFLWQTIVRNSCISVCKNHITQFLVLCNYIMFYYLSLFLYQLIYIIFFVLHLY